MTLSSFPTDVPTSRPTNRRASRLTARTVAPPLGGRAWSIRPPRTVIPFPELPPAPSPALVVGPPSDLSRLVLAVAAPERRWVLRRTFERTGLVEVVAEVDDGPSCLDAVLEHAPDFAVVELQHQDADELRLVRLVSQAGQKPSVVVLADVSDPHRLELVLRSGAAGVVRRDAPPYDVVRQVHAVLGLPRGTGWCPEPA